MNTTCNYIHGSRRIANDLRMWKTILLISEDQLNDILDIQLKAYKSNTSCFANHVLNLLKKYDVKESLSYIASLSKNKWEKLLQKKSVKFNIEYCIPRRRSINPS